MKIPFISSFLAFIAILFHSGSISHSTDSHILQTHKNVVMTKISKPTPTNILPTDTPTPTFIPLTTCLINNTILNVTQSTCEQAKQTIQNFRNQDSANVQTKIDNLKGLEQPYLDKENSINFQSCDNVGFIGGNPSLNTQAMQNCSNGLMNMSRLYENMINTYASQIQTLNTYKDSITNGGSGNGACSDHGGVDPKNRGDLGQVLCNDGWSQSTVYYFNVDECVRFYINNNFEH